MKRRRLLALAVAPAVALVGTGTAYAVWTLTLNSAGTVTIAKLSDPAGLGKSNVTTTEAGIIWTAPTAAPDSKTTYVAIATATGKEARSCTAAASAGTCLLTGLDPATDYSVAVQAELHEWKSATKYLDFRTLSPAAADTAAPTQQITAPATDGFVAAGAVVTVTGTASDPSGVTALKLQRKVGTAEWQDVATGSTAAANATATVNYQWTAPTSGVTKFRTFATDGASQANSGPSTVERTMTVGVASLLVEAPAAFTAGTAQDVKLTAKKADGTTDIAVTGVRTVTWGGTAYVNSPNGTAPSAGTASFSNGVATVSVNLRKAVIDGTLTATTSGYSAGSDDVTVAAAAASALAFVDCSRPANNVDCAGPISMGNSSGTTMTGYVRLIDAHGNAATRAQATTVALSSSRTGSFTVTTSVSIAAGQSASGQLTVTQQSNGNQSDTNITASFSGLTGASVTVT